GAATADAGTATVVLGNLVASLATLPMALELPHVVVPALHLADVLVIVYLGVVQIGLAYFLMSTAMPNVPALEASTILLIGPALNPVWVWIVHGERPSALSLSGGALIILAAAAKSLWDARRLPFARGAGKASA